MNVSLLCKWFWRLETEPGIWQEIIKYKYLKHKFVCTVKHRQSDSAIWHDLLKIRDVYLQGRKIIVGNGRKTLFWRDKWLYEKSLEVLFPDLFAMCLQQNITVEQVKNDSTAVTCLLCWEWCEKWLPFAKKLIL